MYMKIRVQWTYNDIHNNHSNIMGKWSDDSACSVVHDVRLYSVLDTVVISGDDVCCSVVFGSLVGVFVHISGED